MSSVLFGHVNQELLFENTYFLGNLLPSFIVPLVCNSPSVLKHSESFASVNGDME